jgi:hypothetical protein
VWCIFLYISQYEPSDPGVVPISASGNFSKEPRGDTTYKISMLWALCIEKKDMFNI